MTPTHLVRRFFGALWPAPPRAQDEAWAATVLAPQELLLFRRLPNHDRRHALQVAHRAQASLGPEADRWVVAAMLHDVGKYDAGLSVPARAVATIVAIGPSGESRVTRWACTRGWRRRVALDERLGELGAEQIRRAGGREEAAVWSEAHHHPERWRELSIPPAVVQALDDADQV